MRGSGAGTKCFGHLGSQSVLFQAVDKKPGTPIEMDRHSNQSLKLY